MKFAETFQFLCFAAEQKKLELAEKFKELQKKGKVDQYLAKKRKKTAAKDRKRLPLPEWM